MSTQPEDDLTPQTLAPSAGADLSACPPAPESSVPEAIVPVAVPVAPGPLLFENWEQPRLRPPARIPHLGHCLLLGAIAAFGLILAGLAVALALHFHLYGISTRAQVVLDIRYNLGSEAILYLTTLGISLVVFPILWQRSLFSGLQWNGTTAYRLRWQLLSAAFLCLLLAIVSSSLLPSPKDAPIDKIFRSPGAPWMMFAFGTTIAPFFEEFFFRGFLLPALCTAFDWIGERVRNVAPPPLDEQNHPRWSQGAMIAGALFTSIPFAAIHLAQTAYSIGTFVLLISVSLVLCTARLWARSLAASVLVHAAYNFILFSIMLLGTSGFSQLDKL
jgi:hypothetical protein